MKLAMIGVLTFGVWVWLDAVQYLTWSLARWTVVALWRAEYGRMAPW